MAGQTPKLASSRYVVREATAEDEEGWLDCFFSSFNAPFWQYFMPGKGYHRQWMADSYKLSLNNPTDINFVAIDTESVNKDKIVALSRWMKPQQDGNQERKWADIDETQWDMEIFEAFFGGMEANRKKLMQDRPHWSESFSLRWKDMLTSPVLELLATDEKYQKQGLAATLIKWGTDQADSQGLETYLDGSEKGQPYYLKWHNFEAQGAQGDIAIPNRPDKYGSYRYMSLVRPSQQSGK